MWARSPAPGSLLLLLLQQVAPTLSPAPPGAPGAQTPDPGERPLQQVSAQTQAGLGPLAAEHGGQPPAASRNSSPTQGGATHHIPHLGEEGGGLTWPCSVTGRLTGELSAPPNWPFSPSSSLSHRPHPFFPQRPASWTPSSSVHSQTWAAPPATGTVLRKGSLTLPRALQGLPPSS